MNLMLPYLHTKTQLLQPI